MTAAPAARRLPRLVALMVLAASYAACLVLARALRRLPRRRFPPSGRLAAVGTFHNRNWILSHAIPLSRSGATEVLVVGDDPLEGPAPIRFFHPPRWLRRIAGRGPAKLVWLLRLGLRHRPDLYIGYHLFPGALTALAVARLLRRPACYQMTGGPVEIDGGGVWNENWLMASLRRPAPALERLALAVVREFDLVVALGGKATAFLAARGVDPARVAVVPGSIAPPAPRADAERDIDMVFVGRLTEIKQPLRFVEAVAGVRSRLGAVRAAMAGDGPLLGDVRRRVAELGLADCLEVLGRRDDVEQLVGRSRVYLLTSRSEGLSIAMTEAMAAGAVPVVADVGELGDVVEDGRTGYRVAPGAGADFVEPVVRLLQDPAAWARLSRAAAQAAWAYAGREAVAERWRRAVRGAIERHSG